MPKKILIVEDEIAIRIILEQTLEDLEDAGVEILTASNGQQALETIQAEEPDLVFLDIMMPVMDGFEVCSKVKRELGMEEVYIVMLTAKGQEYDRRKGMEVGADLYVTKPFDPDELVALAERVLGM